MRLIIKYKNFSSFALFSLFFNLLSLLHPIHEASADDVMAKMRVHNRPVVNYDALHKWGFKSNGTYKVEQTVWGKKKYGPAEIYVQSVESHLPSRGSSVTVSFDIIHEKYMFRQDATERELSLVKLSEHKNMKWDSIIVRKEWFGAGKDVYIIATDGISNAPDLQSDLLRHLKQYLFRQYFGHR